jgi:acetolactate synthase-1/2/3 large subunit
LRLADLVVEKLLDFGVRESFIVTGRGSLFLTDAIARQPALTSVSVHHEQSAGYAAIAAAVTSRRASSCMLSTGVGSTNAVSAVLSAWQDEIPVIFVSGQNYSTHATALTGESIRSYGEQEANIVKLVKSITNFSFTLGNPSEISDLMDEALARSMGPRKGPVWLDIPLDFQSSRTTKHVKEFPQRNPQKSFEAVNLDAKPFLSKLASCSRPVLLLGSGANWISPSALEELIVKLNFPVVYESAAASTFPLAHPLMVGSVGALGCSRAGNFALHNSDLVLAIGSQFRTSLTGDSDSLFAPSSEIFLIDTGTDQIRKSLKSRVKLAPIDFSGLLELVNKSPLQKDLSDWNSKCSFWKKSFPVGFSINEQNGIDLYELSQQLGTLAPENSIFVTDSGLVELIVPSNANFQKNQRLVHPHSQGAMGFALPAAIGAATASESPVIAVIGDGSIMMNIQELETIRSTASNIKIIVISNNAYAIIRRRQKELFRERTIGTDSGNGVTTPDFKKVSEAFEIPYLKISKLGIKEKGNLSAFLASPGPGLCEVQGLDDQDYIRQASRKLESGVHQIMGLDDLAPFLPQEFIHEQLDVEHIYSNEERN